LIRERTQELKRASWIGIVGNSFLALLKISIGFISGSLAVIGDGIDTLSDVLTYIITLFTARIISNLPIVNILMAIEKLKQFLLKFFLL